MALLLRTASFFLVLLLLAPQSGAALVRIQDGATPLENAAASLGGVLVYAGPELNGGELWRSDGTTAGTYLVKDLQLESARSPSHFIAGGGLVYFAATGDSPGIWRTDGTSAGTFRLGGDGLSAGTVGVAGSHVLFFASENSSNSSVALWRSDGTVDGTVRVRGGFTFFWGSFARVGNTTFFVGTSEAHGTELWKTDGTEQGTVMVKDILPGSGSSFPASLASVNGVVVFAARADSITYQVWRSDGTEAGTYSVSQFVDNRGPRTLFQAGPEMGGIVFFNAGDVFSGMELWRSDGTVAGTHSVRDLYPGDSSSFPGIFGSHNGLLFFRASDPEGTRYWRSNGASAGTWSVTEEFPIGVNPDRSIGGSAGRFYFDGYDLNSRKSIWSTDGSPFAARIAVPSRADTQIPWARTTSAGLFFAAESQGQRSLWFLPASDPGGDVDGDAIPDAVEAPEGRDPYIKDNDLFGSARLFAMQQYRDFLGREGDSGGVTFWGSQLTNGARTRAQMVESFFNSTEFQAYGAPVVRLYFAYFLRIPDYGGLNYWIGRFRGGDSLDAISNQFASSPEFANIYGSLDDAGFVDRVYRNVLGRAPDSGGMAYWRGQLDAGMTRGQMMVAFSESDEYRALITHEVYVTMLYVGMLRRQPDASGFSHWVNWLEAGNSGPALIQGFLDSTEYRKRFLP